MARTSIHILRTLLIANVTLLLFSGALLIQAHKSSSKESSLLPLMSKNPILTLKQIEALEKKFHPYGKGFPALDREIEIYWQKDKDTIFLLQPRGDEFPKGDYRALGAVSFFRLDRDGVEPKFVSEEIAHPNVKAFSH